MQIRTTLRLHLIPVRMAKIKNTNYNLYWGRYGVKGTLLHCWWKCKLIQPALNISMVISDKIRKQPTSRPSNTTFQYKLKGCWIVPQGPVLNYLHSSIFCHSQKLETIEMPLDQRIDEENVVHLQNGVLHSRKKWHLEICRQMDGTRKHQYWVR